MTRGRGAKRPPGEDPELREDEAMLVDKLGDLGARGGAGGGTVGGGLGAGLAGLLPGARAGRAGGRAGARWGSKRLPLDVGELTMELPTSPETVLAAMAEMLTREGELAEGQTGGPDRVRGVIGAGAFNMNPAVVRVVATPLPAGGSRVTVRALAKEGLIKQRAGQEAAARVRDYLARSSSQG